MKYIRNTRYADHHDELADAEIVRCEVSVLPDGFCVDEHFIRESAAEGLCEVWFEEVQ